MDRLQIIVVAKKYLLCNCSSVSRINSSDKRARLKLVTSPSLRSWRYCKRPRSKVLAREPTSERRSREEMGRGTLKYRYFRRMGRGTLKYWYFRVPLPILLAASPLACPKLYFAGAYNTASYAGYLFGRFARFTLPFT